MSGQTKQKPQKGKKQQYCSIGQASVILGVSIATLRRWEKSGKIKAYRLDGKNRSFKISDLDKLNSVKLLSTAEVAKQLRVSESSVRRLQQRGELQGDRGQNSKYLFTQQAIDDYKQLKASRKASKASEPSLAQMLQQETEKRVEQAEELLEIDNDKGYISPAEIPHPFLSGALAAIATIALLITPWKNLGSVNTTPSGPVSSNTSQSTSRPAEKIDGANIVDRTVTGAKLAAESVDIGNLSKEVQKKLTNNAITNIFNNQNSYNTYNTNNVYNTTNNSVGDTVSAGTGISVSSNNNDKTISVAYGSVAGSAAEGNKTIICPTGSGNITGGGNSIAVGAGGTCNSLGIVSNPIFTGQVTAGGLASSGTITFSGLGQGLVRSSVTGELSTNFVQNSDFDSTQIYSNITKLNNVTVGGQLAVSGLANGIVKSTAGVLSGGNTVTLGSDTTGSYIQNLGTLTGLTTTGNTGAGSTPTLAVAYGATANTSVQGNTTLICPSGTGNLSGTGNTITLGSGGTCNSLSIVSNPTFTGLMTSLGVNAGSGSIQGTGGLAITGNSTITGTLSGLTGLTVASGGASITGNSTVTGTLGVTGNFNINTNKFSVTASSGNTSIAGTLGITGNLSVNNNKFNVTASNGNTSIAGTLSVAGDTLINPYTNSATAFRVQNNTGGNIFAVDTANEKLFISSPNTVYGTITTPVIGGTTTSQGLLVTTGDNLATGASSGDLSIASGTGDTYSGAINISTGYSSNGTSGLINIDTGGAAYDTGSINIGGNATAINLYSAAYLNNTLQVTGGINNNLGGITSAGAISGATGITSSGIVTFSGLNTAGVVKNNALGVLSTGKVALGSDTTGSYIQNLGTLTGLTTSGNTGAGSTPTLAVAYGATANTSVQGNTTLICPSGTGNLSGTGNTITLGSGGTCNSLSIVSNPTFTGALTAVGINAGTGSIQGTGGLSLTGNFLQSGTGTFGTATGNVSLNGNTTIRSSSNSTTVFQIQNASATPLMLADTTNGIVSVRNYSTNESLVAGSDLVGGVNWTDNGNWNGANTNASTNTFQHITSGGTSPYTQTLTNTWYPTSTSNYYQISFTVTGRTTGSFTMAMGGVTSNTWSSTGTWSVKPTSATVSDYLVITPTADFNGTITFTVKQLTATSLSPTLRVTDSAGSTALELRTGGLTSAQNAFIGYNSGRYNTTGFQNTGFGYSALRDVISGYGNTAMGSQSQLVNTAGSWNTSFGAQSLLANTIGWNNTAFGAASLASNTTGSSNTAFGTNALYSNTTASSNTAIGYYSQFLSSTATSNTSVGYQSLYNNLTGGNNTTVGHYSGRSLLSGSSNTFLGYISGYDSGTVTTTTTANSGGGASPTASTTLPVASINSIALGEYVSGTGIAANTYVAGISGLNITLSSAATVASGTSVTFSVQKSDASNTTAIGNGTLTTANNQIILGNSSVNQVNIQGNPSNSLYQTTTAGSTISALLQLGNRLTSSSANTSSNGGTYFGVNAPSTLAGSAADFINLQNNGTSVLTVGSTGNTVHKTSTNSATAFQIQNSSNAVLLNQDTSSGDLSVVAGNTYLGLSPPIVTGLTCASTGGSLGSALYFYKIAALTSYGWTNTSINNSYCSTSGSTNKNTFSWNPVPVTGATTYRVYRMTNANTSVWYYNDLGSSATSIIDDGTTYTWTNTATPPTSNSTSGGTLNVATNANVAGKITTNSLDFANPGIGNTSQINFLKYSDTASIRVSEVASDKTDYAFYMSDNPDGNDNFMWSWADWKNQGSGWNPLNMNTLTNTFTGLSNNFYGPLNMPALGAYATGNLVTSYDGTTCTTTTIRCNFQVLTTSTPVLKDAGSGSGQVFWDASSYNQTSSNAYWVLVDGTGSTFSWGTGSYVGNGGTATATGVAITAGSFQSLSNGVSVKFSTASNSVGDRWSMRAYPASALTVGGTSSLGTFTVYTPTNPTKSSSVIRAASAYGSGAQNLQEWQNNSGTALAKVDNSGALTVTVASSSAGFALCTATNGAGTKTIEDCAAAPSADYAEQYPLASGIGYGDIVATGSKVVNTYADENGAVNWDKVKGQITELVRSSSVGQSNTVGVVSDNYGDFTSAGHNIKQEDNPMPVALNGRVPVNMAPDSEPVSAGDYLTTSGTYPGKATKATGAGYVIGKALAGWSSGQSQVMIFVEPGYNSGPSTVSYIQDGGSASLVNLTVNGTLEVKGLLKVADIEVNGHIITKGNTPQIAAKAAAGSGATVSIEGNDTAGTITINSGSGAVSGDLAEITFAKVFGSKPRVILSASNDKAAKLQLFKTASSSGFVLKAADGTTLTDGSTYEIDYQIMQ